MDVTKIGKYDIVRELGRGAMGIVYEGVDPYIGRKVAIKTIRFDVLTAPAEQQEAQQRFMREARSAGNLSHPSIVTIYEVGEHEGLSFIAMEFIAGESLESMIAARRRPPFEGVVDLIAQIGDALDYAHRNGIIHRDIKPANILVATDGRPRIVDFGIARIASSSLTQTNTVLGTPSYMAPEQIAGLPVDHRADLFALGAILYELLTFERAFSGDNVTTVIYKIMNVAPPSPRVFDQSLSSGLDAVLSVALAKDPAERYQSGRALAEDLRNYEQFEDGGARAPAQTMTATVVPTAIPTGPTVAPPSRSRRTLLLAVVGTMMAVLVIAVVAGLLLSRRGERYTATDGSVASGAAIPDASASAAPTTSAPAPVAPSPTIDASTRPPAAAGAPPSGSVAMTPLKPVAPPKPVAPLSRPTQSAPSAAGALRQSAPTKLADPKALVQEPDRASAPSVPLGRVYEATDVDQRPRVLRHVDPIYPEEAARLRLQDVVVVKALVGPTGRVEDTQLLRRSVKDVAFNTAALNAVRQYTFAPARKKGQSVSCWFNVGVPFQLSR